MFLTKIPLDILPKFRYYSNQNPLVIITKSPF